MYRAEDEKREQDGRLPTEGRYAWRYRCHVYVRMCERIDVLLRSVVCINLFGRLPAVGRGVSEVEGGIG